MVKWIRLWGLSSKVTDWNPVTANQHPHLQSSVVEGLFPELDALVAFY